MLESGDIAPTFTATRGTSDHEPFELVSEMSGDAIRAYDLEIDIAELGLHGIANRAVFVIDEAGTISYA